MNIFFVTALIILVVAIMIVLSLLIIKFENENKLNTIQTLQDILDASGFHPIETHFVNRHLTIALNKNQTKIALIENFNPNNPAFYNYKEIALTFIEKIEKNVTLKIHYVKKGEIKTLNLYPLNKELIDFVHRIFQTSLIKRVEAKFPQVRFTNFSASDWECRYFWAFSKYDSTFVYMKTGHKFELGKINLKREHFTIDTKFKYFEAPVFGIPQQLFVYDKMFLAEIFESMLDYIKHKYSAIVQNSIYFDNYGNTIYLTNGNTSLQSVVIDKIEDVYYQENRIVFELYEQNRRINFLSYSQQIIDFENFVIDFNLKKIAQSFDSKTDKLVNTTPFTKLIIDFSRNRVIYCANLNKFAKFSYLIISFDSLKNVSVEKSGMKHFVRLTTKDKEIIDVTCDKKEVAQYIEALIAKILN